MRGTDLLYAATSRIYAAHDPMGSTSRSCYALSSTDFAMCYALSGPPIEVCTGHGRCTNYGCECDLGYGGDKCQRLANCSGMCAKPETQKPKA
eukprot:3532810-Rhodomonas_salina.4